MISGLDPSKPCQCNNACTEYGDCCDDYEEVCLNGGGGGSDSTCVDRCGDGETRDEFLALTIRE